MRRRDFIKVVAGSAVTWPLAARAQQAGKLPRIGIILVEPSELTEALSQGLREAGYVDGQNIVLDLRDHYGSLEPSSAWTLGPSLLSLCNLSVGT
jgi:putative tryptophan/tyrosine transport system substrate-binding protein